MPTFIDESGCCGTAPNSQPYFRLVAVWFPTGDDAEACRTALETVRTHHKLPPSYEFKYSSWLSDEVREAYFAAVAKLDYCFAAVHFDKRSRPITVDKEGLYRACMSELVSQLHPQYLYAEELKCARQGRSVRLAERVTPDENSDGFYLKLLKEHFYSLKSEKGKSLVGDVKPAASHTDQLLQFADMICGAVGDHLTGKSRFFRQIASHALRVAVLPEQKQEASGADTTRPRDFGCSVRGYRTLLRTVDS